jgi:hypothetical protein
MADDEKKKRKNLPAKISDLKRSLMAAAASMGPARGGGNFLKVDDRTGAMIVGINRDPFPTKHRYAVNLRTIAHGYIVFGEPGGTREVIVPMVDQDVKPVPAGGYAEVFSEAGAKDAVRIYLTDLDEPGYEVKFDALGKSNANRVRQLFYDSLAHLDTEEGLAGFVHPVIRAFSGHYFHKVQGREIFHLDYEIIDWLSDDDNGGLAKAGRRWRRVDRRRALGCRRAPTGSAALAYESCLDERRRKGSHTRGSPTYHDHPRRDHAPSDCRRPARQ